MMDNKELEFELQTMEQILAQSIAAFNKKLKRYATKKEYSLFVDFEEENKSNDIIIPSEFKNKIGVLRLKVTNLKTKKEKVLITYHSALIKSPVVLECTQEDYARCRVTLYRNIFSEMFGTFAIISEHTLDTTQATHAKG